MPRPKSDDKRNALLAAATRIIVTQGLSAPTMGIAKEARIANGSLFTDLVFSLQLERTVNRDNTVSFQNLVLQIEKVSWRGTLAGCTVTVHQHLDATLSITYGPQRLGRYTSQGEPMVKTSAALAAVEKPLRGKVKKQTFPPRLEIPQTARDSHFPTASAAGL
jgi:hypothetical protein